MNKGLKWHQAEQDSAAASDGTHMRSAMQYHAGSTEATQSSFL